MSTQKTYIGGFSYETGENTHKIEELEEIAGQQDLINKFKEVGLENYRTTELSPLALAEKSIIKLFKQVTVLPSEIDAIVFSTSSFWYTEDFTEYALSDFLLRNGLENAYPIASSFSYCGNYITALRTANQYITSGEFKNILVVVSDHVSDNATRIVPPNISIGSDAASCCILSSNKISDFVISGISQTINAALIKIDADKEFPRYMQAVAQGIITNVTKSLILANKEKSSITKVLPNNYNKWITPSMLQLVDIPIEKVNLENIPKIAHAGASDICINLADYFSSDEQKPNDVLLLLSTGPMMWGSAIIEPA